MRMRKKRHGAERIAACSEYFITNQSEYNSFPAELEIGCGKGAFILGCAKRYPDRNFVAPRITELLHKHKLKVVGKKKSPRSTRSVAIFRSTEV